MDNEKKIIPLTEREWFRVILFMLIMAAGAFAIVSIPFIEIK